MSLNIYKIFWVKGTLYGGSKIKNNLIISNSLSSVMPLSSYRMHKIYLAATMNYGLGSYDPEELAYYNKIKKDMANMKKEPVKKGIPLNWDALKG